MGNKPQINISTTSTAIELEVKEAIIVDVELVDKEDIGGEVVMRIGMGFEVVAVDQGGHGMLKY